MENLKTGKIEEIIILRVMLPIFPKAAPRQATLYGNNHFGKCYDPIPFYFNRDFQLDVIPNRKTLSLYLIRLIKEADPIDMPLVDTGENFLMEV